MLISAIKQKGCWRENSDVRKILYLSISFFKKKKRNAYRIHFQVVSSLKYTLENNDHILLNFHFRQSVSLSMLYYKNSIIPIFLQSKSRTSSSVTPATSKLGQASMSTLELEAEAISLGHEILEAKLRELENGIAHLR